MTGCMDLCRRWRSAIRIMRRAIRRFVSLAVVMRIRRGMLWAWFDDFMSSVIPFFSFLFFFISFFLLFFYTSFLLLYFLYFFHFLSGSHCIGYPLRPLHRVGHGVWFYLIWFTLYIPCHWFVDIYFSSICSICCLSFFVLGRAWFTSGGFHYHHYHYFHVHSLSLSLFDFI